MQLIKSVLPVVTSLILSGGVFCELSTAHGSSASQASFVVRGRENLNAQTHIQAKFALGAPLAHLVERAKITVGGQDIDPEEGKAAPSGVTVIEGEGLVVTAGNASATKPEGAKASKATDAAKPTGEVASATEGSSGETVIEGEGIVLTPGGMKPAGWGESTGPTAEGEAEEAETPKTINVNGTPFQVSGEDVTVNGKPLEPEAEKGGEDVEGAKEETTKTVNINGAPFQVSGDITLNGNL